jgi:universal stress protein E
MTSTHPLGTARRVIAVGEDFTPAARLAVERATRIGLTTGSALILTHAVAESAVVQLDDSQEIFDGVMPSASSEGIAAIRAAAQLEEERVDVDAAGVRAAAVVRAGDPATALAELATLRGAWLLVVGIHRVEPGESLVLGTTAEKALREGATPVLVVRAPAAGPYRRVLLPVDAEEPSIRALRLAARLAPDAEFEAVHFIHPHASPEQRGHEHRDAVISSLRNLCADAGLPPERTRVRAFVAAARDGIVGEIENRRPDLIAMGTHARRGVARVVLGSVADFAIHAADGVDVLVTPPER